MAFDQTLFSADILHGLQKSLVGREITNQNYVGNVVSGKTVTVYKGTAITAGAYTGAELSFQALGSGTDTLVISSADYFAYEVPDVDELFSNAELAAGHVQSAVYSLMDKADTAILAAINTAATGDNIIPGLGVVEASDFAQLIRTASLRLRKANSPRGGYVVLPPEGVGLLSEYMTEKVQDLETARAGFQGMFEGLRVYESNNLPLSDDVYSAVYGHEEATTFANDLSEVEIVRPANTFSNVVKGLHVYGVKVFRPEIVGRITLDFDPE